MAFYGGPSVQAPAARGSNYAGGEAAKRLQCVDERRDDDINEIEPNKQGSRSLKPRVTHAQAQRKERKSGRAS